MTRRCGRHAVVLGSGMAGLAAARVLGEHFTRVTVCEAESRPSSCASPPGYDHALLPGGIDVLGRLFPGLISALDMQGAIRAFPGDLAWYDARSRHYSNGANSPPPRRLQDMSYFQSRGLIERCVREEVACLRNITIRYDCRVTEPLVEPALDGTSRVTGVRLPTGAEVLADLVVDATGQSSLTVGWLGQLGYPAPPESVIHCDFGYTSVFLKPWDPGALTGTGLFVLPTGDSPHRSAGLVRMEGGLWLASLAGRFGDYPPADWDGFRNFARSLANAVFADLVETATPVSEFAGYRYPRSVRRHFERLEAFPAGLLPIGDAICHYNPVYGQGMTAASRQIAALQRLLARRADAGTGVAGLALEFFPLAFEEPRGPWLMAAVQDFLQPQCSGDFPREESAALEVMRYLHERIGCNDAEASELARDVQGLRKPLSALLESPWPERAAESRLRA